MNEYNMNEEQNMPDEVWRRTFDEAAETPLPRVWDAIERQLDEPGAGRVVPLWATGLLRPVVWGTGLAAAAVLLVVGFWLARTEPAEQPAVARVQPVEPKQPLAAVRPEQAATTASERAILPNETVAQWSPAPKTKQSANSLVSTGEPETVAATADFNHERSYRKQTGRVDEIEREFSTLLPRAVTRITLTEPVARPATVLLTNTTSNDTPIESIFPAFVEPEQLASRGVQPYEMRPIQRVVWFGPAETDAMAQPAEEQVRVAAKTKWVSVTVMPGVFNPEVSVGVPTYVNSMGFSPNTRAGNESVVSSRGSVAIAVQATAGVQLTDRWSVESGMGYLVGRSTVESPGAQPLYNFAQSGNIANNIPAAMGNLYTDLLRSQMGNVPATLNMGAANDLLISNTNRYANLGSYGNRQTVANNYAYVQVPVQVGYELRPRKRLTLAILGGLITNIFVKNSVDDALTIKAGDGVYQPVALVASMGARFRYRSSERWSASLAGMYQPAITPGTRPDSPVQTQPTTTGLLVGIDYRF